ncbi:MAG: hypothetical protein IID46_08990, partial [Planctomycetes bacterium]|nr:hypothetical protein [Planctomycetota bacterium]
MNNGNDRLRLLAVCVSLLLILSVPALTKGDAKSDGLKALVSQRVHPVLIRNDHNPLFHLEVHAKTPFVMVRSITVSLAGTDDRDDIDSLQIFFTGDSAAFSTSASFGDSEQADDTIVFRGHARLRAGTNHFWLSCRLKHDADLDHKIDATSTGIETSAGRITPVDKTNGIRKRIGIALRKHYDDGVHTYRIPALATTPQGTLLCVYDMRRRKSKDLQEDIDIGLLRSTDGGRYWEAQRV